MHWQQTDTIPEALANGFVSMNEKGHIILKGSEGLVLTYIIQSRQFEFAPAKDPIDSLQKWHKKYKKGMSIRNVFGRRVDFFEE